MTIDAGIRILPDAGQVAQAAAALFVDSAVAAIQARGCFHACLAGGATPRETYALLASGPERGIDWTRVQVYFGDERCVPPDHADSNYRMAMDALLCQVNVEPAHIHRIPAELGAVPAADDYEQTLRACLASSDNRFDLVLLGLGADGHTASLFPGTAALHVRDRWCVANSAPGLRLDRITLTFPIFDIARRVVFLVTGINKAEALRSVFTEPINLEQRPAQGVCPAHGELVWLMDRTAASLLPPEARTRIT